MENKDDKNVTSGKKAFVRISATITEEARDMLQDIANSESSERPNMSAVIERLVREEEKRKGGKKGK